MATKAEQIQNLVKTLGGEPRNSTIEDAIEDLVAVVEAGGIGGGSGGGGGSVMFDIDRYNKKTFGHYDSDTDSITLATDDEIQTVIDSGATIWLKTAGGGRLLVLKLEYGYAITDSGESGTMCWQLSVRNGIVDETYQNAIAE